MENPFLTPRFGDWMQRFDTEENEMPPEGLKWAAMLQDQGYRGLEELPQHTRNQITHQGTKTFLPELKGEQKQPGNTGFIQIRYK